MTEKKTGFSALAQSAFAPQEKLAMVRNGSGAFIIGLPREIALQEKRITLTPDAVALLVNNGHQVWVET
ncbi:MAG: alanine dehydrogenase, partial [Bacteroidota bacterium]